MARTLNDTTNCLKVTADTAYRFTTGMTVAAWVYPTAFNVGAGSNKTVIGKITSNFVDGYVLRTEGNVDPATLNWYCYISGAYRNAKEGAASIHVNTWYHVAGTYDGTTGTLYKNGASQATFTQAGSITTNTDPLGFGCLAFGAPVNGMAGSIAECAAWNVALTANEMKALSLGCMPYLIRPTALVGYWPINGLSSPEPDYSGSANNATIVGTCGLVNGPAVTLFTPKSPMQMIQVFINPFGCISNVGTSFTAIGV